MTDSPSLGGTITRMQTINFSSAKQQFSFGTEARIPELRKQATDVIGYDLPSTKAKRSAGFGFGDRFKSPRKPGDDSPPPNTYMLSTDFDIGKPGTTSSIRKKGMYSFGASREVYKKVYIPQVAQNFDNVPGPGSYATPVGVGTEGKNWKMQGRTPDFTDNALIAIKQKIPGPGTYDATIEIHPTGKYCVSTIPSSKAQNWSPSKKRFRDENRQMQYIPGPGAYRLSECLGDKKATSKFRNPGSPRMQPAYTPNESRIKNNSPGPGTYQLPSEFGRLDLYKLRNRQIDMETTSRSPRSNMNGVESGSRRAVSMLERGYKTQNQFYNTMSGQKQKQNDVMTPLGGFDTASSNLNTTHEGTIRNNTSAMIQRQEKAMNRVYNVPKLKSKHNRNQTQHQMLRQFNTFFAENTNTEDDARGLFSVSNNGRTGVSALATNYAVGSPRAQPRRFSKQPLKIKHTRPTQSVMMYRNKKGISQTPMSQNHQQAPDRALIELDRRAVYQFHPQQSGGRDQYTSLTAQNTDHHDLLIPQRQLDMMRIEATNPTPKYTTNETSGQAL